MSIKPQNNHSTHFDNVFEKMELTTDNIREVAREKKFLKRAPRKITPESFLRLILFESIETEPSYNDLAAKYEATTGIVVSRQAFGHKMKAPCAAFMQSILAKAIKMRGTKKLPLRSASGVFRRILVQDSTILRLPSRLFDHYSGVANAHCKVCNARLQAVIDLIGGEFISFSIDSYSHNDSLAAPELDIQAGDLVLRDRGYISADEIQRHQDADAHCIYRHRHNTTYCDPRTNKPIDLLKLLRKYGQIDMKVRLNNKAGTICRLVAAPVDEETANLRRMKLKKEQSGHAPSKELLELASWTLFLTTIDSETINFQELLSLYGLRWRIEIIFKAWKSHLNFASIHNVSKAQLLILINARLIIAVALMHLIYTPFGQITQRASLLKVTRYFARFPERIDEAIRALDQPSTSAPILIALRKYCTYDRRKRLSFNDKIELCNMLLS